MFFQVTREGRPLGEFSATMISAKLYQGELRGTDLYRGEGMSIWRALAEYGSSHLPATSNPQPPLRHNEANTGAILVVVDAPAVIAFAGSLIILLGVFAPAVSIPLLGSMSYLQNGRGPGAIVILSALASVLFAATRRFRYLWVTGSVASLCLAASLIAFEYEIHQMKHSTAVVRHDLLAGLESAAADATQLGWGYAVMFCGAITLFAAAAIGTGKLQFRR